MEDTVPIGTERRMMFRDPYSGQAIPAPADRPGDDECGEPSASDSDALRAWREVEDENGDEHEDDSVPDEDPEFNLEVARLADFLWSQDAAEEIEPEPIPDD